MCLCTGNSRALEMTCQINSQNTATIPAEQQYPREKNTTTTTPKTLNHSLNTFEDNKKHVTPGAFNGMTQANSTHRVRGFPFTWLLQQCLEVIPHFYSQSIIGPASFLHPWPTYSETNEQGEETECNFYVSGENASPKLHSENRKHIWRKKINGKQTTRNKSTIIPKEHLNYH